MMMETKAPLSLDTTIKVAFSMEGRDKLTKVCSIVLRTLSVVIQPRSD